MPSVIVQGGSLEVLRVVASTVLQCAGPKSEQQKLVSWSFQTGQEKASHSWTWRVGQSSSRARSSAFFPSGFFSTVEAPTNSELNIAVPLSHLVLALAVQQGQARVQFVLSGGSPTELGMTDDLPQDVVLQVAAVVPDPSAFKFTSGLSPLLDPLQGDVWPETRPSSLFDLRRKCSHIQVNPEVLYSVTTEMIGLQQPSEGHLIWTTYPYNSDHPNDPLLQWTLRRGRTTGSWDFLAEGLLTAGTTLRDLDNPRFQQILHMPTELSLIFDLKVIHPVLLTLRCSAVACELVFLPDGNLLLCVAYGREGLTGPSELVTVTHLVTTIQNNPAAEFPGPSPTASVRRMSQVS